MTIRPLEGSYTVANREKLLGEILIELKIITPTQLEFALAEQAKTPGVRLGQVLVQLGYATPSQIMNAISKQLGFLTLGDRATVRRKGWAT